MGVRDETAETPCEVHGAKNNEVREATKKSPHACARARDGERPASYARGREGGILKQDVDRRSGEPGRGEPAAWFVTAAYLRLE